MKKKIIYTLIVLALLASFTSASAVTNDSPKAVIQYYTLTADAPFKLITNGPILGTLPTGTVFRISKTSFGMTAIHLTNEPYWFQTPTERWWWIETSLLQYEPN